MEGKYGAIDTDDYSCHGYCIINFSSSPYNLQAELSIDGQVISSEKHCVKELISFQSVLILIIMFHNKQNP